MADERPRFVWRNMLFRNLGTSLSSNLIRTALLRTYEEWAWRYGQLPAERLRTEIDIRAVKSSNPGCCYKHAGWGDKEVVRGKVYLYAPEPPADLALRATQGSGWVPENVQVPLWWGMRERVENKDC